VDDLAIVVGPALEDGELNALFAAAWVLHTPRSFAPILERSLVYLAAFADEELVGFVHVAWDGGVHAFLLEPTVDPRYQRRGLGRALVARAATIARERGAEWLHADYPPALRGFYAAVGFLPTEAGLLPLRP
jgi:GNAT superfamily N-acetyltransferase